MIVLYKMLGIESVLWVMYLCVNMYIYYLGKLRNVSVHVWNWAWDWAHRVCSELVLTFYDNFGNFCMSVYLCVCVCVCVSDYAFQHVSTYTPHTWWTHSLKCARCVRSRFFGRILSIFAKQILWINTSCTGYVLYMFKNCARVDVFYPNLLRTYY
jgi:hypothetical protein